MDKEIKKSEVIGYLTTNEPRFIIEYFCLILLALITFNISINGNFEQSIPFLAGAALAMQKLFPYAQRGYEKWATLRYENDALSSLLNYISYENCSKNTIDNNLFKENIIFESLEFINVNYEYKNQPVLENINLKINKGDKLAIVGESGCGKSTFLRLTCGLLLPTQGEIKLNGDSLHNFEKNQNVTNWMRSIGYVPQKINLTGKTLRENIIFGVNERQYDHLDIEDIIEISCLEDLIKRCDGLDNEIFQNSFNLSGGEMQRLAIARALYRNPKLLLMDEPTSSLDTETQEKVLRNMLSIANMTCILITHRIEIMHYFDRVVKVENKNFREFSL